MRAFHSIAGRGHIGRGAPCSDSGCFARGRRSILQAVCRHACCKPLHLLVRPGLSLVFGAGDDSEYCDGWSEKQFDVGQASSKCLGWIGSNPPHLAGSDTGESITGLVCIVPLLAKPSHLCALRGRLNRRRFLMALASLSRRLAHSA